MSTTNPTAPAESKPTKIQLARDVEGWNDLRQLIDGCVRQICDDHDEKTVRSLMLLVDLVSNQDFDENQRAVAAEYAQNAAFAHTGTSITAKTSFLNELNPGRVMRRRKVVVHA